VTHINLPELPGAVWSLSEDHRGQVWISTYNRGYCQVTSGAAMRRWDAADGISNSGRCVFEDREHNLWLGSSGDGVTRLTPQRFQHFPVTPDGASPVVHSVWPEPGGGMLVATYGAGLVHLTEAGRTNLVFPGVGPEAFLQSALRDRSGRLWIGGLGRPIRLMEAGAMRRVPGDADALNVVAIFEDSAGHVWFGWGGREIRMFADGKFHRFGPGQGLPRGSDSECFAEHDSGEVWVSNGSGVFRWEDRERFIEVTSPSGEAIPRIECLLAEPEGSMWLGSADRGLIRVQGENVSELGEDVGLPAGSIWGLVQDDHGFLWIVSGRKVVRVLLSDLHAVADRRQERLDFQVLDANDGMPQNTSFTGGRQPNCVKDGKGRLWFAMSKGAVMIDPATVQFNHVPPPVHVERLSFLADGSTSTEQVTLGSRRMADAPTQVSIPSIVLPPGSRNIEIQYAGLSYAALEKVSYRFKLEGLDRDWTDVGTRRSALYPVLPPGDYTFRVTACNNDGVWNDSGTSLALVLQPYYWQTWWFRPAIVATLLGLGGTATWWRFQTHVKRVHERERAAKEISRLAGRLLHAQEDERRRIARELHDDFSQQLALLSVEMELLQGALPGTGRPEERRLEEMTARIKELSSEVHRMAHELHPAKLDQLGLVAAARAFCRSLSEQQELEVAFRQTGFPRSLPADVSLCCYRVIQEALQNVLRHSDARRADVELRAEPERVCLTVTDSGKGFDLAETRRKGGLGLSSMEERVRHAGGRLTIRSNPEQGTRVEVRLPISPADPAS
jgi:signal transduction histidine kinase